MLIDEVLEVEPGKSIKAVKNVDESEYYCDWNNWSDPALWVTVGDPGNAPDTEYNNPGRGSVGYTYQLATFDVTAGQYCYFLNAVATTDSHGLYDEHMDVDVYPGWYGCNIKRSGSPGTYTYSVASDWANRPVNYVSWVNAARFVNWLANGHPTGEQEFGTTENGSYDMTDAVPLRQAGARYVIPTEDEWYKAAFYDPDKPGGPGYWNFPTRSDTVPSNVLSATGTNNANFRDPDPTIGPPYYRTEVGAFAGSPSPSGTFDQGGNVQQWIESVAPGYSGPDRGHRGGVFASDSSCMTAGYKAVAFATYANYGNGFRVTRVPEPATLSLLALGGLALRLRSLRSEPQGRRQGGR